MRIHAGQRAHSHRARPAGRLVRSGTHSWQDGSYEPELTPAMLPLDGRQIPDTARAPGASKSWIGVSALALAVLLAGAGAWLVRRSGTGMAAESAALAGADSSRGEPLAIEMPEASPTGSASGSRAAVPADAGPVATAKPNESEFDPLLYGFVRDPQGQPLPNSTGAGVTLVNDLGERVEVKVNQAGAYSRAGLAPGRWFAAAHAKGCHTQEAVIEFALHPLEQRQDFELRLMPSIRVKLLAPDGRPLREASSSSVGDG